MTGLITNDRYCQRASGMGWEFSVMPQPRDLMTPPIGQRRCPGCGVPMFLSEAEMTEVHEDLRTFECQLCSYAETVAVQFS